MNMLYKYATDFLATTLFQSIRSIHIQQIRSVFLFLHIYFNRYEKAL